jgi:hypothetical protein
MRPLFSATKTRPSGEKRTIVGALRPVIATVSWKPGSRPSDPVRKDWSAPQPEPFALEAQAR